MLVALVGKQGVGKTTLADKMSTQGFFFKYEKFLYYD